MLVDIIIFKYLHNKMSFHFGEFGLKNKLYLRNEETNRDHFDTCTNIQILISDKSWPLKVLNENATKKLCRSIRQRRTRYVILYKRLAYTIKVVETLFPTALRIIIVQNQ